MKVSLINEKIDNRDFIEGSSSVDILEIQISLAKLNDFEVELSISQAKYIGLVIPSSIANIESFISFFVLYRRLQFLELLAEPLYQTRAVAKILCVDAEANCNWKGQKIDAFKKHGHALLPITKAIFGR